MLAESFYEEVMVQLVVAVGAAPFLGNLMALFRPRKDAPARVVAQNGRSTGAHKGRATPSQKKPPRQVDPDYERAPIARTVLYMTIGLFVMVWGLATLLS